MLHMTYGSIEKNGVVVFCDYLFYGLIDGTTHGRIVLAIGELPYYQSAEVREDTAHLEVADHAVDMVMTLTYILNKENRELLAEELVTQSVTCALQAVQNREVTAHDRCVRGAVMVHGVSRPEIIHALIRQEASQGAYRFAVFGQRSDMLAHDAVDRELVAVRRCLMQGGDVTEADDRFMNRRHLVDDTL